MNRTRRARISARTAAFGIAFTVVLTFVAGCGGSVQTGPRPSIETLRERAADSPRDADAQRALAIGEMLLQGGDYARVSQQLERARALAPRDPRLLYLSGVYYELAGHPGSALSFYLDALEAAAVSPLGIASFVAEAAAEGVEDLVDVAPHWADRASERLAAIAETPGHIGPAARYVVGRSLIEIDYRRGDDAAVRRIAADHGCVTEVRSAGPFGAHALLGFDERFAPEPGAEPLAARYDLGAARGERATRTLSARGCVIHLGGGPVADGGTTYAQAIVEVPRDGDYVVRLETPNAIELFVDGASVARLDHRRQPLVRSTFHRQRLSAGRHWLLAKITTRHPNPVLSIAITDARGFAAARESAAGAGHENHSTDTALGRPRGGGVFEAYLRAAVAMARGDVVGARQALRRELPERSASPVMLQLASGVALGDPLRPADVSRDAARRYLRRARARDADAWFPVVQLARLDAADGHVLAALEALAGAETRWPEVVAIPLLRAELLISRGWDAQASREVAAAKAVAPGSCAPLRGALAAAERRLRHEEMNELAEALVACDARNAVRFTLALRARDWDRADAELARLTTLEPLQSRLTLLGSRLGVARGRGDDAAIDEILEEMATLGPRSMLAPMDRADRRLAAGDEAGAQRVLAAAVAREPSALGELRHLNRAIGGEFALRQHRKDGAEVIRAFEASDRSYDQPEVLILDYTVVRVFDDGSSLELTHNIWKVQSDEAVDGRGEFTPPPGARVLTLHTVKADGRRIEADVIEGKTSISLPNLAIGDYVEYEYVSVGEPPMAFAGGFLGDRFYFRSFETPYDLSQLTVVMPSSMEPVLDPRGPAPETERREADGLTVLRWTVHESRPLEAEPMSVNPKEYLPSINVGVRATWPRFLDSLRDALADQDVRDPAAESVVARILGEGRRAPRRFRAQRLYRWVLSNIEDTNDVFGLAPAMLAERTGNRARILHYLYGLAGVPSRLVIARSLGADTSEARLPDPETYQNLLVVVGEGDRATYISTVDRGAPFGYVPPPLRGQPALVLAEGGGEVHVPEGVDGADRRTIEVDTLIAADGSAVVEVVETFRGAPAVSWRRDLESIPAAMLNQRFEEGYVARLAPGARLEDLRITGRDALERPLVFQYTLSVSELGNRQGGQRRVQQLFPTLLAPTFASIAERTTPQLVAPAVDVDVTMRLRVAGELTIPELPTRVHLEGPSGADFVAVAEREEGAMILRRRVRVPSMRIPAERYAEFAGFCRQADQAEAREIVVRAP